MKMIPDLTFYGNCLEALDYYKMIFNGEIVQMVTYEEAVIDCDKERLNNVFSAVMVVGKNTLYFSDDYSIPKSKAEGKLATMIEFYNEEEMRNIFLKILNEGKILQNIQETNWGSLYASVEDKYGFIWNLSYELSLA